MADPRQDAVQETPTHDAPERPRARRPVAILAALLIVAVAVLALAGGTLTSRPDASAGATTALATLSGSPAASPSLAASASSGTSSQASPGLIAIVDDGGALSTLDDRGGSRVSYPVPGVTFGFPAWSPDGSRIAAVGQGASDAAIYVFPVGGSGGPGVQPTIVYRSPDRQPFYLYWTPDSRQVSFLTTDTNGLALRVAPVAAGSPIDQNDPAYVLRRGAPLYLDWIDGSRVLLHVGDGSTAFVGQVGLRGVAIGSPVAGSGIFRTASLSRDGRYEAYATSGTGTADDIVIRTTTGSADRRVPAFGPVAMLFDPTGDRLAAIAADKPLAQSVGFPLGPLRLIDPATGAARTILGGSVVAFFWAPDGKTIAALRVIEPGQGPTAAAAGVALTAARVLYPRAGAADAATGSMADLAFVDPATGTIRAERTVQLSDLFVNDLLPYFDQYALSQSIWSPDGASVLLPLVTSSGQDQVVEIPADGTASRTVAGGSSGFWSP